VHFYDRYNAGAGGKVYEAGLGTGGGLPGKLLGGGLGLGAGGVVGDAYSKIVAYYQDPAVRAANEPIDIIGYSRGAFSAMSLASQIASDGVPINSTATYKVDDKGHKKLAHCDFFQPKIRFIGLLSPVGEMGVPFTKINPGFPSQVPAGTQVLAQALDSDGDSFLYPQSVMTAPKSVPTTQQVFPDNHPQIGGNLNALAWLIAQAQKVGVPVK
jgi:hypothetical protein